MPSKFLIWSTFVVLISAQCLVNDIADNVYLFSDYGSFKLLHDSREPQSLQIHISGKNKCFFEQYSNSVFLLDLMAHKLTSYSFSTGNISTIAVESNGLPLEDANIVLDHNTVTFYAVHNGIMYNAPVDFKTSVVAFKVMKDLKLDSSNMVIGFGQNHLHLINLPGNGEARIFVIHYAFLQEAVQRYGSSDLFPQMSGKTVSVPKQDNSVPLEFAFIPNDFSGTFLVDTRVEGTNSSVKYPPPIKDLNSLFVATTKEIVQLTSSLELYTLDITQNRSTVAADRHNWVKVESTISSIISNLPRSDISNTTIDGSTAGSGGNRNGTFAKSSSSSHSSLNGFIALIVLGWILVI